MKGLSGSGAGITRADVAQRRRLRVHGPAVGEGAAQV